MNVTALKHPRRARGRVSIVYTIGKFRALTAILFDLWKKAPHAVLSCIDGSDEHWQFFHPDDFEAGETPMPRVFLSPCGHIDYFSGPEGKTVSTHINDPVFVDMLN
jgi:hypothetical protein